jgi:cellulose synthase (UDP-forming)
VLPNLSFFASSGFPYTRMADLSGTAVVLPERPNAVEISAFLELVGRLSSQVGHPATASPWWARHGWPRSRTAT